MPLNSGALVQQLIDGGLTPTSAKAIANAIANAASPQFSTGGDTADVTPTEALRMIDADQRRYSLTNLDYSPEQPFADRLEGLRGIYANEDTDHPYKGSQPRVTSPPLSAPAIRGSDYVAVEVGEESRATVHTVRLKLRKQLGQHLRINSATSSLDGVPLTANSLTPKYLAAEVRESDEGTEISVNLRGLQTVDTVLSNGTTRKMLAWAAEDAQAMSVAARDSLVAALATPRAFVNFRGNNDSPSGYTSATYGRAGTTVTVTLNNHGYRVGHFVSCDFTSGGAADGDYNITTVTQNTFTLETVASGTIAAASTVTLRTLPIRSSLNIHSVHHMLGSAGANVGDYHVNFLTAMPDGNYCAVATCTARGGAAADNVVVGFGSTATSAVNSNYDTNGLRVIAQRAGGTQLNQQTVCIAIFR